LSNKKARQGGGAAQFLSEAESAPDYQTTERFETHAGRRPEGHAVKLRSYNW